LHCRGQGFDAIVKFVITKRADIIANLRHGFVFNFTLIKIEVRSALKDITAVDQECIWILLAHTLNQRSSPRHSAFTRIEFVVCGYWIDLGVSVVGMKNSDQRFAATGLQRRRR
jgi:hypothetical protein